MSRFLETTDAIADKHSVDLAYLRELDNRLLEHFRPKIEVAASLTRALVSFQANKVRSSYRWYKFKEAFSASLVEQLLDKYAVRTGKILDPFAGSGTALFAGSSMGLDADGIELLPIGHAIIQTRNLVETGLAPNDVAALSKWAAMQHWRQSRVRSPLPELRITKGAYPNNTREAIELYLGASAEETPPVQAVLRFALLCVLESISFTRKDGQYLRWDHRSGRRHGKKVFNKGRIQTFADAVSRKLDEILSDISSAGQTNLFANPVPRGRVRLLAGSCLDILPRLPASAYDAIITSPPYCNRYDYTRTYALELALLGTNEQQLVDLRQEMLSCTVENRAKDLIGMNAAWAKAISVADSQELLQAILSHLERERQHGRLNNNGIPRMVRGYFYEMACVIYECARVLKPNALFFMVNDNVRYAGVGISVDAILSDFAEKLGCQVEKILVLPEEKGNSSQQMGQHGRESLRKCVYVWRKQR